MKWKEKDDLSWCCVSRRRSDDDDDDNDNDRKDPGNQTSKVPEMPRSTKELALSVEKVKNRRKNERKKRQKHLCFVSSFFFIFSFLLFSVLFFLICALFHYDDSSFSASNACFSDTSLFYSKGLRIRPNKIFDRQLIDAIIFVCFISI